MFSLPFCSGSFKVNLPLFVTTVSSFGSKLAQEFLSKIDIDLLIVYFFLYIKL